MSARDFLFELGTEELPPKSLKNLMQSLHGSVAKQLDALGLNYESLQSFATPRRLAVLVNKLDAQQSDTRVERRGPPVKIAFDDKGEPTRAAQKFIESCGVTLDQLTTRKTDKGEWLLFEGIEKGRATHELMAAVINQSLAELPIARRMRWGDRSDEFVRPLHWSVMLWGADVIPAEVVGTRSGRSTRGHRFHAPQPIELEAPDRYTVRLLDEGRVMVDFAQRRAHILELIEQAAATLGGTAIVDDPLLDEVTALVEWPVPVAGRFEERYLALPDEVLISTLQDHQRYFPLRDDSGSLLPWFITLSNIESKNPDAVRDGNERVVRPRLSDAEFFYRVDRKQSLADRIDALGAVLFQKQLGTLQQKVERIGALAAVIAPQIGADVQQTARAAALCKCDLQTEMVGEFPDLQGIMGRYYATHDGEAADVAAAMAEHYLPRHAGDALPATAVGQAIAIADRIDTITGIFAIGRPPSGTSDPFGLRRAALGVLRIVLDGALDIDLRQLVVAAVAALPDIAPKKGAKQPPASGDKLVALVFDYVVERLRGLVMDERGATPGQFDAVLASRGDHPVDLVARLDAVQAFAGHEAATSLIAANKRIANILRKSQDKVGDVDPARFEDDDERTLHAALLSVSDVVANCVERRDYTGALNQLSTLRGPVDAFFDNVLVMADDDDVRRNRLALLHKLRDLFLGIADFSLAAQ